MMLTVAEQSFDSGEWQLAWEHLGPPPSRMIGILRIFRQLREAELALGVGDLELAARCLSDIEPLVAESSEPQWIGGLGALLSELLRREHDLEGARQAVADALDRIELCTDDVIRIARVSAVGACIEADLAQRARDLRERADERDAISRARIHAQRLRAAAQSGGPVEAAWERIGVAELGRARGRNDPRSWARAAESWESIQIPYRAAIARWRQAEALVEADDRSGAADVLAGVLETAQRLGSQWLEQEAIALRDRARLPLPGAEDGRDGGAEADGATDPFGLTPRERQVLALIAEGATNRQIGNALFMAEKTASVHVSRILAKLGVHSRTQAAAVAHRLQLSR
jgi:DNA-binding CsgD family transcriptional regulator